MDSPNRNGSNIFTTLTALATCALSPMAAASQSLLPGGHLSLERSAAVSLTTGEEGTSLGVHLAESVTGRLRVGVGYQRFLPDGGDGTDANQFSLGVGVAILEGPLELSAAGEGVYIGRTVESRDEFFNEDVRFDDRSWRTVLGIVAAVPLSTGGGVTVAPLLAPAVLYSNNLRETVTAAGSTGDPETSLGVSANLGLSVRMRSVVVAGWYAFSSVTEQVSLSPLDAGEGVVGLAVAARF